MPDAKPAKAAPPTLDDFPHHALDVVRLRDLDHQDHVNNAVFATYFETGRVFLLRDLFGGLSRDGSHVALARVEIDYLREVHWPGQIVVGTRVARLGTTSVTFAHGVFKDGVCVAKGQSVMVRIDRQTRRPAAFPPDMAEALRGMMRGAP